MPHSRDRNAPFRRTLATDASRVQKLGTGALAVAGDMLLFRPASKVNARLLRPPILDAAADGRHLPGP